MRNPRKRNASVEDELLAVAPQDVLERRAAGRLVPPRPEDGAAVNQGFVPVGVARHDRVHQECDVRRDALLQQEHEQLAEATQRWTGPTEQAAANLRRWMR